MTAEPVSAESGGQSQARITFIAGEIGNDAEGATAPETLRQKDHDEPRLWKEAPLAPADGITFSGTPTEGAPTIR